MSKTGIVLCVCLAALAACAKGGNSSAQATPEGSPSAARAASDPCSLLTVSEVGRILHVKMAAAERTDATHCTYRPASGAMNTLGLEAQWSGAKEAMSGFRAGNALIGAQGKSPKLGDEAFFGAMNQLLYVRKGDAYFGLDMRAVLADTKKVGPELAQLALKRL